MRPRVTILDRSRFRKRRATERSALAQHIDSVDVSSGEGVEPIETPYFRRKLRILDEASEREILDSNL